MHKPRLIMGSLIKWVSLSLLSNWCMAQDSLPLKQSSFIDKLSIGAKFYHGSFLVTKAKAEYIRDSYASFGEVYFQQETTGSKDWEITHRYPKWGVGYMYGTTGSKQYIGRFHVLFGFMNVPVIKSRAYTGSVRIGFGPGYVTKPFDIYTNSKNTLIGTKLNAYIGLSLQNEFQLSKRIYVDADLSFVHLSNGGTTLPNLGLNIPALTTGLRYSFGEPERESRTLADTNKPSIKYAAYSSVAVKQAPWIGGNYYLINIAQLEATRRMTRNYSYGVGLMLTYNRALDPFPIDTQDAVPEDRKKFQVGIYGSYEHFFGKLSIPIQLGVYAYNKGIYSQLFQQFGLRYRIANKLSTELILKSHTGQAEFFHMGIGYNF